MAGLEVSEIQNFWLYSFKRWYIFQPVQVVYNDKMNNFQEVSKVNIGAALIVKGILVETPNAKQPFEIQADEVFIEGESTSDYPLQKRDILSSTLEQFHI